ncbi:hypothetical protein RLDS_09445 [Sphingobium lactosutens DS20]|uniref:SnoaL-like domain-containing protein n=1 Tax=Sphingobium lactosutens DS20 TaxID=1331060 RepID=T0HHY9_9SPHN|nr:hypothetical protein RLDS_09445 [Sphingobium lactosutens DS20]
MSTVQTASAAYLPTQEELDVTQRNRDHVRWIYECVNNGDFAGLAATRRPDYRLMQAPGHPAAGTWIGEEATAVGGRGFAALGTSSITVHEIVADGPHRVIGLIDLHGTDGDGNPWTMPVAECWWFEDGLMAEVRPFYWNMIEVQRIVGSRSDAGSPPALHGPN